MIKWAEVTASGELVIHPTTTVCSSSLCGTTEVPNVVVAGVLILVVILFAALAIRGGD